jgi:hypothetical protein
MYGISAIVIALIYRQINMYKCEIAVAFSFGFYGFDNKTKLSKPHPRFTLLFQRTIYMTHEIDA